MEKFARLLSSASSSLRFLALGQRIIQNDSWSKNLDNRAGHDLLLRSDNTRGAVRSEDVCVNQSRPDSSPSLSTLGLPAGFPPRSRPPEVLCAGVLGVTQPLWHFPS